MDRKEQPRIWKEKEREKKLLESSMSENIRTSTLAKIQLNLPIFQVSKNEILNFEAPNSFEILQKIELKIIELAYKIKPTKVDCFGVEDEIIKTLSFPLKAVYFTYEFEGLLSLGDADKEFYYENNLEKSEKENYFNELISYYLAMQNPKMISLIEDGKKAKREKDFDKISDNIEKLESENDESKINYIRRNLEHFELK
ncbi:hypothetical protein EZJ43_13485 [Pedobacter changchengzhani]|uniref:Uncharacterized protein n=1 Tax=Pedobacter changchengzhani TaxID=2529274 RepID=A0A4R5MJQ0_9SPHI|nr:hypothetical protein [Pedobacter changchengzhani]TDG35626.1 hypothetical protein EZJ43_13485 [Pedobacter changchengzhani]